MAGAEERGVLVLINAGTKEAPSVEEEAINHLAKVQLPLLLRRGGKDAMDIMEPLNRPSYIYTQT